MRLYYAPRTRATQVRWLLEELGVDYDLARVDLSSKPADYLQIHPLGKVPALTDGDVTLFEAGAICVYLADRYGAGTLAPAIDAPERAEYLQWIFFAVGELEPPLVGYWREPSTELADAFHARARVVAAALGTRDYLLGAQFTAADVMVGNALGWARGAGLLDEHTTLLDYGRRVGGRPTAKKARAD